MLAPASCTKDKEKKVALSDLELQKDNPKELAAKSDDWSSIPGSHTLEGKNWLPVVVLSPAHVHNLTSAPPPPHKVMNG